MSSQLEELRKEKIANANQQIEQREIQDRLSKYRKLFKEYSKMKTFDKEIFEILVKKIIIGIEDEKGNYNPNSILIVMNTGINKTYEYKEGKRAKKYINVTKDIYKKNLHSSMIHNTV